jgi:hypothetical protein
MASISRWEGSQTGDFGGLPATETADDLRHDVIELIGGGGGRDAGCPGEAADELRLLHGVFIVRGACLATAPAGARWFLISIFIMSWLGLSQNIFICCD